MHQGRISSPPGSSRSAIERTLLDEGPMGYVALVGTILIWALELSLNLRQGSGWVYWAHLLAVGPLWLLFTGFFVYALVRKFRRV